MAALTRRGFLSATVAAGGAAAAAPASAAPERPSLRPGPEKPVRALYGEQPYWDFTGAPEAEVRKAKPQVALEELPAAQKWLLGVY